MIARSVRSAIVAIVARVARVPCVRCVPCVLRGVRSRVGPAALLRARLIAVMAMIMIAMTALTAARAEAQLTPSCTIGMSSAMFGNYNPLLATSLDTTGTVSFTCNLFALLPQLALGRGASSTFNPRKMVGPGGVQLSYNIYLDGLHLLIWGDGSDLTTPRFIALGLVGQVTFYGSIPPRQNVVAGTYTDSPVVTIFF
jgi:spore coat protein U-like protein